MPMLIFASLRFVKSACIVVFKPQHVHICLLCIVSNCCVGSPGVRINQPRFDVVNACVMGPSRGRLFVVAHLILLIVFPKRVGMGP